MKTYPPKIQAILDRIREEVAIRGKYSDIEPILDLVNPLADRIMELQESLEAARGIINYKPKHKIK